ncbi:MAG TPA: hypothetical protein VHT71_17015 [Methylomirabilota bacterium]|jgi:hypothetical protein|nr:hypothetical protein [Methylomirabilota bacterium]
MMAGFIAAVLVVGLASAPLLWRVYQDRRQERADIVRAEANTALFRALGGESLVAVEVQAPLLWAPGRVVLSAPSDWQSLLTPAWSGVAEHVPAGYELVVKPVAPVPMAPVEHVELPRAA